MHHYTIFGIASLLLYFTRNCLFCKMKPLTKPALLKDAITKFCVMA